MGNAVNKLCCCERWKRGDRCVDDSPWQSMQRGLMQGDDSLDPHVISGVCSKQGSLSTSEGLCVEGNVAVIEQRHTEYSNEEPAETEDTLGHRTEMAISLSENEQRSADDKLRQCAEEASYDSKGSYNSGDSDRSKEEIEGLKWWEAMVDGKVDNSSRWHSTHRGVGTTVLLGNHLVLAWREMARVGKGSKVFARCARDLSLELKSYERESRLLIKLADTGRVVQTIQRAIKTVVGVLHLQGSSEAETWLQQLQEERDKRVQLYHELLDDEERLLVELGDEQQQVELQTLLKYGLKAYRDVLTPGERGVMSTAFDVSVQRSGIAVATIPSWFAITEHEWHGAEKSSVVGGEEKCLREVSVWSTLQHPNVRKFYGACHVGKEPFLIHEWEYEPLSFRWRDCFGYARGILYMHERGLVHTNLTESHLLKPGIGDKGVLSGLGLVCSSTINESLRGSSGEYDVSRSGSQHPSRANDVMRLGVIVFQLLVHFREGTSQQEILETSEAKPLPDMKPEFVKGDEWRLLQGMCSPDPADRTSMLDVVYQIATLTIQEESPSDQEAPNTGLETVIDVCQYLIPSLNKTTKEVLARAKDLCNTTDHGLADLHQPVLKRLLDIYDQLVEFPSPPRFCLVEAFAITLERWFCSLEHNVSFSLSQSSVGSLCASRTIAGRNYGLHYDIDRLLQEYSADGLNNSAAVHRWKPSWKEVCERQQQILETLVGDPSSALEGMKSEAERSEALTLLESEAQNTGLRRAGTLNALPLWFIPPHCVQLGKHLADGSFGSVYEGMYLDTPVVVKQVLTSGLEVEEQQQFLQEANLWFSLNHENLIKLFGACHEGRPFFVCEQAMGGTIVEFPKKLDVWGGFIWYLLKQAALGLLHLHDYGIVHGDLKGNNILVGRDGIAKLADFGLSFTANMSDSSTAADEGALGAFRWKAPEVLQGGKPTFASDIYSFAMCIIETVTGKFPWGNSIPDSAVKYNVVQRRLLPQRPEGFDDKQWELVTRMCCYDPEKRITAGALVMTLEGFL